jgi:uncharacterized membrane protein
MNEHGYLKRLRRDLPSWIENGWVTPAGGRAILDHVAAAGGPRFLAHALAVLGVLLLGSGVITFFAANWGVIPKAAKLAILFGAMWAAYAVSGHFLRRDAAALGQALLLLGVILFGANISLIAQIYHIDAHYPDGVFIWSAGALLAAGLVPSAPALVLCLVLAALWSGMETYAFDAGPHWPFFALWIPAVWLVHRDASRPARHAALVVLLLWFVNTFFAVAGFAVGWTRSDLVYLVQVYLLSFLSLYILGRAMAWYPRFAAHTATVSAYAAFAALSSFCLLTSPEFERAARAPVSGGWIGLTAAAVILVSGLIVWRYHDTRLAELPRYRRWGLVLLAIALAAFMANLFIPGAGVNAVTIAFNVMFLAGLVWLLNTGVDRGERTMVNLAFGFFALWLLMRYFDTFWSLLNRSFFFMTGGAILLAGGYYLERQRRRLVAAMPRSESRGAP